MFARSFCLLWLPAAVWLAGCARPVMEAQRETLAMERDAAERVKTNLAMGAGILKVRGGARKLMEADFAYTAPPGRPTVTYRSTGALGTLAVEQPGGNVPIGGARNQWDLALSNEVPLDFAARCGAGEANLELGDLDLRSVNVQMGAGRVTLDLRGRTRHDYSARLQGGVGSARVYLPPEAELYLEASGGIGDIHVRGMQREENHWVHDAPPGAPHIRVEIRGEIGSIDVIANQ
jgi:hypothetical protein